MKHHTKDKGDIGIGYTIADLLSKGIQVCLPISEHQPYDLIGIYPDNSVKKISVKYRKSMRGNIQVKLESCYSDSKGVHIKPIDKLSIDMLAIYCPDTNKVYYVNHNNSNLTVTLRVTKPKNNQVKGISFADDYLVP